MKKICIIFGGNSSEHDISIITGMQCKKHLDLSGNIEAIYLGLDNNFYLASKVENIDYFAKKDTIKLKKVYFLDGVLYQKGIVSKKVCDVDCIINCCHGGIGENGDLAGFFESNKIRISSAGALASHIAMDKSLTKTLLADIVPVIDGVLVGKEDFYSKTKEIRERLSQDLIVKPNSLGSSIGVKICDIDDFESQVQAIFEMKDCALVENRVKNLREFNQACIMDKGKLILSQIEEPKMKSDFLSFQDKYEGGKSKGNDRDIPANISKKLSEQISCYTRSIYERLNMRGVVRIDYIFDVDTKKLYFNEINTVPGSLAYYLFEPIGIDYISLMDILIKNAGEIKKYSYFDSGILSKKLL